MTFGIFLSFCREAKISNIKHHWWWKLNFVNQFFNFEKLILLEEDHALAVDAFDIIGKYFCNLRSKQHVNKVISINSNAIIALAICIRWETIKII